MHVVQGIIGMIGGFLLLVYRPQVKRFVGDISFAEKYLGAGGTWTFLALLGIVIFLISLMWATGSFQEFLGRTIGPFFTG